VHADAPFEILVVKASLAAHDHDDVAGVESLHPE
jgi:hypothetical protein